MLRRLQGLLGLSVKGRAGDLGLIRDVLFDDDYWRVRYLVVAQSPGFRFRQVLLPIERVAEGLARVQNALTTDLPETFTQPTDAGGDWTPRTDLPTPSERFRVMPTTSRLLSAQDLLHMDVEARDGSLGEVDDLAVEDQTWQVLHLVVDMDAWLPSKKILVLPQRVARVDLQEGVLGIDLLREDVRGLSDYDPAPSLEQAFAPTRQGYCRDV